jgi:alkylhydroperoxidase family enzyme
MVLLRNAQDVWQDLTRAKIRLVIDLADAMVAAPSNISDDLYARVRKEFSEEQLMQLSGHIAFENYRARWNRVFDVGSDHVY